MFNVRTNGQIVAFGENKMTLFDNETFSPIIHAERGNSEDAQQWTIIAEGQTAVTTMNRLEAITAMGNMALAFTGNDGYSTFLPSGLDQQP